MKRGFFVLAIMLILVLTACAERVENPNTGNEAAVEPSASPSVDVTQKKDPETTAAGTVNKEGSFTEADLVFEINGLRVELNSDASVLLKELGDGYDLEEAPSCLYDGMDKTFTYTNGIEIYTYPVDG